MKVPEPDDDNPTLEQVEQWESSGDPELQKRARQATARIGSGLRGMKFPALAKTFASDSLASKIAAEMEAGEQAQRRQLQELAAITARREARRAKAEDATVETAELLGLLVDIAQVQQQQLGTMTKAIEVVAMQAVATTEADEERWHKLWPLNVWMLVAAVVAAIASIVAIIVTVLW